MEFHAASGRLPPGFRFDPTDVQLVVHYLKRKVLGKPLEPEVIAEVDIYQFHPEDLRELAHMKEDLVWHFFCARGKKYAHGGKTNRATQSGFWKGTGNGKVVKYQERNVGEKKTLVFHLGKPPKGERTNWVMHEYRLEDSELANKGVPQDAFVLCKIFKKSGRGPKNGEQYGAPYIEEEWDEEEIQIPNNAPMVPVADQDQITSVNDSFFAQVCPLQTSVQVHSGAVSVSISDQAPAPTSYGSNVASTSKSPIQNDDDDDLAIMLSRFYADADDFGCVHDLGFSLKDLSPP